jgi:hypothetical protein
MSNSNCFAGVRIEATQLRRTKRVATGLACVLFATVSFGDCTNTLALKQELNNSEAVIIGTVISSRQVPQSWYTFEGTDFLVHVDQTIKGKRSREITIFSENSVDGYDLQAGRQYLLFLSHNYEHWVVNKCGNSGTIDEEGKVIKELEHLFDNY